MWPCALEERGTVQGSSSQPSTRGPSGHHPCICPEAAICTTASEGTATCARDRGCLTFRLSLPNDEYHTRSDSKTRVNPCPHRGSHLTSKFTNSCYYTYLLASVDERPLLLLYARKVKNQICFLGDSNRVTPNKVPDL